MKGDFTRDTFNPAKHFSRVLKQQGRVTLDADFNEQDAINLHYLRTLARDIIGPYAAPADPVNGGFMLNPHSNDVFSIGAGRYYVDGILVENEQDCSYRKQPDYIPSPDTDPLLQAVQRNDTSTQFGIYLDVWERHITAIQVDSIREKALGGRDTCTRAKVVWQVKALTLTGTDLLTKQSQKETAADDALGNCLAITAGYAKDFQGATTLGNEITILEQQLLPATDDLAQARQRSRLIVHDALLSELVRVSNASLAARVNPAQQSEDPCVTSPVSKYRGAENQLYRVEIHQGGQVGAASFKWSRDNGSVVTAWLDLQGQDLKVLSTRGFEAGNWVELSDDTSELLGQPGTLVRLVKVEGDTLSIDPATTLLPFSNFPKYPKVRRWDYMAAEAIPLAGDNAIPIQESPAPATPDQIVWIDLEDGVQIQFSAGGNYRTGDYWLIPARVATGNVEWPVDNNSNPQLLPPHGIEHHYALLGLGTALNIKNDRFEFWPLCFSTQPPTYQPLTPTLTSSAASVIVGGSVDFTVTLPDKVTVDTPVTISATANPSGIATVPPTVTVPAGSDSTTFIVATSSEGTLTLTATLPGSPGSVQASVSIEHLKVKEVIVPPKMRVGIDVQGTVTLNFPAPAGGATVFFSGDPGGAVIPAPSVVIPQNTSSSQFNISPKHVAASQVTITASCPQGVNPKPSNPITVFLV